MSTFPLGNNVAVWPSLATVMLPVAVNVPAAGSYSSALARYPLPPYSAGDEHLPARQQRRRVIVPCRGHAAGCRECPGRWVV